MKRGSQKFGLLVIISGSSGSGKSTIVDGLLSRNPDWVRVPSMTTRNKRPGEVNGKDYFFVTKKMFQKAIRGDQLLEWACVHAKEYYGTPKALLLRALREGKVVLQAPNIDGIRSMKKMFPQEQVLVIFLSVPSWRELRQRIVERAPILAEELSRRYESYRREVRASRTLADFVVANEFGKQKKVILRVEQMILRKWQKIR